MSCVTVRPIRSSDAAAIAGLSEEAFADSYPFDWNANAEALVGASASGRVSVCIAEDGGDIVGYCNLRAWPAGGWIDQIAVRRSHRRLGVGRALLVAILEQAKARGFWKVSLIVSAADLAALRFYESSGFTRVGAMKDEIRPGTDGILLSCITDYALHPNP